MSRHGFAVPLAVLLLLALTGLAHGALLLVRAEEASSRLAARLLARELAVRGALLAAAHAGDTLPLLAVGSETELPVTPLDGVPPVRLGVVRLERELYLLRARPEATGAGGGTGLVLWALDPLARTAGTEPWGAATVAPGGSIGGAEPPFPDPCAPVRASLGSLEPTASGPGVSPPGLGLLSADTVLARAPLRLAGTVAPGPGADPWVCPAAAGPSWGAPSGPAHSCAEHRPFVASDGDLALDGGEGRGVLAVRGDLTLHATLFEGLLLAGGRVSLHGGAVVRGRIAAAAGVEVGSGSSLLDDGCAAYLALRAATPLRVPLLLPGGAWIRPL